MTLIVGVKCSDGIVVGADSTATYSTQLGQQSTIRQDTITKLHIASEKLVVGVSGPVSLSQFYGDEVDAYLRAKGFKIAWRNVADAKTDLAQKFWKHAGPMWEKAGIVSRTVGPAAMVECNHASAVAFAIEETPHLIQFSTQCNGEEVTQELPFVAIGSGQPPADTFLAFIRRIFWPSGLPSLTDGQVATIWTLDEVIKSTPGGIGGEVKVVVLKKSAKGHWKCEFLSDEEMDTHRRMIADVENGMLEAMRPKLEAPPTPIPEPPAAE